MNQIIFLLLLIVLAIGLPLVFNMSNILEGYSNYSLGQVSGNFPDAQTQILLQDTYPTIGKNELSNNTANDIWMEYPVFPLGSYAQTTNNIRYPDNPDEGTCTPASMCGALYHDKKIGNNNVELLPQINPDCGTRVGYFATDEQVVTSLPYRSDLQNILY